MSKEKGEERGEGRGAGRGKGREAGRETTRAGEKRERRAQKIKERQAHVCTRTRDGSSIGTNTYY